MKSPNCDCETERGGTRPSKRPRLVSMKCPNCYNEMERGQFTLSNNVMWYPGDRRWGLVKGPVWLAGRWRGFFFGLFRKQAEGYICQKCRWACFEYPG